jgi:hypothetical protein
MTREFDLKHGGEVYWVEVEFDTISVDDSFDGHLYGRVHTFEASHREADMDSLEVVSCTDGEGAEVEPDAGLLKAIAAHVAELDLED